MERHRVLQDKLKRGRMESPEWFVRFQINSKSWKRIRSGQRVLREGSRSVLTGGAVSPKTSLQRRVSPRKEG